MNGSSVVSPVDGLPLFQAPSGPQTPVPSRQANSLAAYWAWRRTEVGGEVFGWMLTEARRLHARGDLRVSTKALVEAARAGFQTTINNSWTSMIADELVAADAQLEPIIERRRRTRGAA